MTMSAERIAEIRELCEKATPGPWEWNSDDPKSKYATPPELLDEIDKKGKVKNER